MMAVGEMDGLAVLLRVAGVVMLLLVPLNLFDVPRRFDWRTDMASLTLLNRQIFWVHAWFLCLMLAMLGLLSLWLAKPLLVPTPLARALTGGLAVFWAVRLVLQWAYYSWHIWRGNRFYTIVHFVFTLLWLFLTVTFALAWMRTMEMV
jgi:hypothetical protein